MIELTGEELTVLLLAAGVGASSLLVPADKRLVRELLKRLQGVQDGSA